MTRRIPRRTRITFLLSRRGACSFPDEDSGPNLLLMDVKGSMGFSRFKRQAKEQYDYWQPDNILIEAKATGTTLQQELRRMGIPVTMYSPGVACGQDKVSRALPQPRFIRAGMVWAPDETWAGSD